MNKKETDLIDQFIKTDLEPFIKEIDQARYYPEKFLKAIGQAGFFNSRGIPAEDVRTREVQLIERTATHCMTTAFLIWCHLAALASVRMTTNPYIKVNLLPRLESGEILGGTGLSNALKYYAGLGTIQLKAHRTEGGYLISGHLTSVSNLGQDHWFTIQASINNEERVIGILPAGAEGLTLEEKTGFAGMNGSKTFSCDFDQVYLPDKWVLTENADDYIPQLRPNLVLYQIPLGLGVSAASIKHIGEIYKNGVEDYQLLNIQPEQLESALKLISNTIYGYAKMTDLVSINKKILLTKLKMVHFTSKTVHADMLFSGGPGYLWDSDPFRRLRESYFLVNLTPTVKQLEKLRS